MTSTAVIALIAAGAGANQPHAQELPQGGHVEAGQATIQSAQSGSMTVTQASGTAVLGWQSFSIGMGGSVHFNNGSGATLNRVLGNVPSSLDGSLTATGSLYLINPAGVTVGTNGFVSTGGSFVASTHDVDNATFMAGGDMTFRGTSGAGVVNHGAISSANGDIALIARKVENTGTIDAPNGTAALAAGYEVLLRDTDHANGKILVKAGGADTEVKTSGVIRGAAVELRANGGNVYALAGNTQGIVKATGVQNRGGRIFLTAGDTGTVKVTQKVAARRAPRQQTSTASTQRAGGEVRISGGDVTLGSTIDVRGDGAEGGVIVATGKTVKVDAFARLDASGEMGGTILVGGDYQGGHDAATKFVTEDVANAINTTVEAGADIRADGLDGDGGRIVVWSDEATSFDGHVNARGNGAGDGGFAEVSGKQLLGFTGTVDLASQWGENGTLLLDPYNVTISTGLTSNGSLSDGTFTPSGSSSVLQVSTLVSALNSANVIVTTGGAGSAGVEAGDITVADDITWSSASTLTLDAYRNITVNANITGGAGAKIVLQADNSGTGFGTVAFQSTSIKATATGGVSVYYNPSSYATPTSYSNNQGAGTTITGYMLVNTLNQLQSINTNSTTRAGIYALGRNIDATATSGWNGGAGFVPIGTSGNAFTGTFDGRGYVIDRLTINRPATDYVGLFGHTQSSKISNVGLTNVSITGKGYVGALAGRNFANGSNGVASIVNSYATGTVTGNDWYVGGLVGAHDTTFNNNATALISHSWANVTVSGAGRVGGLVGRSQAETLSTNIIEHSHATGAVSSAGTDQVGGLIGQLSAINGTANVSQSYATGSVSGANDIGGLIGQIGGSGTGTSQITQSYATGNVTGGNGVGGLVGAFQPSSGGSGVLDRTYALGSVTGNNYVGGLVGYMSGDTATAQYSYASGHVTGNGSTGGLVGAFAGNPNVTNSYWDTTTTGQSVPISGNPTHPGATGLQSSNSGGANYAFTQASYSGWDFTNDWFMVAGSTRPFGRWEYSTTITNSHQLQLMAMDLSGSYTLDRDISLADLFQAGGMWTSAGFSSLGTFQGILDGLGHTISGLFINTPSSNDVGLISTLASNGVIRDLHLTNVSVTGNERVGGLVGSNSGIISGSSSAGSVSSASGTVGGLTGESDGQILSSHSSANVTTTGENAGGLTGNNSGIISQSYATGNVTSNHDNVGGLVGNHLDSGSISQSYATGHVTGRNRIGGLIGAMGMTASLSDSYYESGTVTGVSMVGGLIGNLFITNTTLNLSGLSVDATVDGDDHVGGLIGELSFNNASLTMDEISIAGTLTGLYNVGGLVGNAFYVNGSVASLTEVESDMTVTGFERTGGLFGNLHLSDSSLTIDQSFTTGSITGNDVVGGLIGYAGAYDSNSHLKVDRSYASGAIEGANLVGGLIGRSHLESTSGTILIDRSSASSTVQASGSFSGGLIGSIITYNGTTTIKSSSASGSVSGVHSSGGLIGHVDSNGADSILVIEDTHATGDVTTSGDVAAGLIGTLTGSSGQTTSLTDSYYSTGSVTGTEKVGGLIGNLYIHNSELNLSNLSAENTLTGTNSVGGLVGELVADGSDITIDQSHAHGNIEGNDKTGGLIGMLAMLNGSTVSLTQSGSNIVATGNNSTGGLVGEVSIAGGSSFVIAQSSTSGALEGQNRVGGLIGTFFQSNGNASLSDVWSDMDVAGADNVGGLIGDLYVANGPATITQSYASGAISGQAKIGGLIGVGLIDGASAELAVTLTHATGSVLGTSQTGGLIGSLSAVNGGEATLEDNYALGPVQGGDMTGGLIGSLIADGGSTSVLTRSYAIGLVSGTSNVGGLVGSSTLSTISASFWNPLSSGQSQAVGDVTDHTGIAALQTANPAGPNYAYDAATFTAAGWNMAGPWEIVADVSYPYHTFRFGGGVTIFAGNVSDAAGGNAGLAVKAAADGALLGSAYTGADGSYYMVLDGTNADAATAWMTGDRFGGSPTSSKGQTVAALASVAGQPFKHAYGLDITAGFLTVNTGLSTMTGVIGDLLAQAKGALTDPAIVYATAGADLTLEADMGLRLSASNAFDIDADLVATGSGRIVVSSDGELTISSGAQVTSAASGVAVVIAGDTFNNERGSDAIVTSNGHWRVHALAPTGNNYGDLDSNNTAIWNTAFDPAGVSASGNRYVFAYQPTLTLTATDQGKTYGDTIDLSGDYSATGLQAGVANAYLGDTVGTALTGNAAINSTGAAATADVGDYDINIAQGTIASNYALTFVDGTLTVGQRAITVTADDASKTYGDANPAFSAQVTGGSLAAHHATLQDALADLAVTSAATATSDVGAYDIEALGTNANYALTFVDGTLTVGQRSLTVTADDASKTYGDADPTLTWSLTTGTLASFDSINTVFAGHIDRANGETVGNYAINQGSLSVNPNYIMLFNAGNFSILQNIINESHREPIKYTDAIEKHHPIDIVTPISELKNKIYFDGNQISLKCRQNDTSKECGPSD